MSGIARMLLTEGVGVAGSDARDSEVLALLREMGATVHVGQRADNIAEDCEMVVISAAIKDSNPEVAEARRRGIEVVKYARALGLLMAEKKGIAVSGTHGKTTATAMIAVILTTAGFDPSFVVGGHVRDLGTSSREGHNGLFVAEACEYDRSFLNLRPRIAIITNIEEDHLDYYSDLAEIVGAFTDFAALVPEDGLLIANAHDRDAIGVAHTARCRVETFGSQIEADWRAENVDPGGGRYTFDLVCRGERLGSVSLAIPGVHNVFNALAAAAATSALGVDFEGIKAGLGAFHGASRRAELVGQARGVTIVDDYAHHPTEIQVTLKAIRDFYRPQRLWVVFQPHQHSRTRFFLKDFARSFSNADRVIVPDIFFVRDSDQERTAVNAEDLVSELVALGSDAQYLSGWDEIVDALASRVADGDVVVTMGAGNVNSVAYALLERLQRDM